MGASTTNSVKRLDNHWIMVTELAFWHVFACKKAHCFTGGQFSSITSPPLQTQHYKALHKPHCTRKHTQTQTIRIIFLIHSAILKVLRENNKNQHQGTEELSVLLWCWNGCQLRLHPHEGCVHNKSNTAIKKQCFPPFILSENLTLRYICGGRRHIRERLKPGSTFCLPQSVSRCI